MCLVQSPTYGHHQRYHEDPRKSDVSLLQLKRTAKEKPQNPKNQGMSELIKAREKAWGGQVRLGGQPKDHHYPAYCENTIKPVVVD